MSKQLHITFSTISMTCLVSLTLACAIPCLADPIPIRGPVTITRPGSYLLDSDIELCAYGPIIAIRSDNVTFDLGNHSIRCSGTRSGMIGILIDHVADVSIRNGRFDGVETALRWQAPTNRSAYLDLSALNIRRSMTGMDLVGSSHKQTVHVKNTIVSNVTTGLRMEAIDGGFITRTSIQYANKGTSGCALYLVAVHG